MKYKTIIITGLDILTDTKQELFKYLLDKLDGLIIYNKSFKDLNYYISELKYNEHLKDNFKDFINTTLVVWLDNSAADKLYKSPELYNSEINNSKTTVKLLDNIDNIYFDTLTDDYYITIIPTIKAIISTNDEKTRSNLLIEFS